MSSCSVKDPSSQAIAERYELFLDEASAIANAWFDGVDGSDRAGLIVQMASAMMHAESTETLGRTIRSLTRETA